MPHGRGAGEACGVIALLAPGQGAQTPGMLTPWLVDGPGADDARAALARWSDATGLDLERLGTTADAEEIKDTAVTQPLVVARRSRSRPVAPDQRARAARASSAPGPSTSHGASIPGVCAP